MSIPRTRFARLGRAFLAALPFRPVTPDTIAADRIWACLRAFTGNRWQAEELGKALTFLGACYPHPDTLYDIGLAYARGDLTGSPAWQAIRTFYNNSQTDHRDTAATMRDLGKQE